MEILKKLEKRKLLKELDYIKSELTYRKEVVSLNDPIFISSVNEFLDKNPEVKKTFDEKINSKIDDLLEKEKQRILIEELDEFEVTDDVIIEPEFEKTEEDIQVEKLNKKIKGLYRQIVKLTHPDKVSNKKLNELYLEATEHYKKEDIISLYFICDELDISYELEESEFNLISDNISKFREQMKFLENTFTWNWYNTENKDEVVIEYIKRQLI
jgi:hypothetical protein